MLNVTSLIFYNFLNMRTKSKHRQEDLKKSLSQLLQIQKKHLPLQPQSREIATIKWNDGALVQLVRIHACHAWGHGFESRTHRFSRKQKLEKALILNRIRAFLFVWGEAEYSVSEKYARCKFRVLLGASEKAPETHNNRNSPR